MNKIQELVYRNVKKYKKHYLFVSILIFCVSVFFFSCTMIFNNQYEAEKRYYQNKYGTWYYSARLKTEDIPLFEKELSEYNSKMKYCYLYEQGKVNNSWIVHASDDNIYELYSLELIEGRKLEKDDEILITNIYQEKHNIKINDVLELTVNNISGNYKVVGILNTNNELYPSIYTNIDKSENVMFVSNHELYRSFYNNTDQYVELEDSHINDFGYSVSSTAQMDFTYDQVIILAEGLILTILVLIALNSTYLKRRNKEFALLRGIGMTNKQLFSMIMYEITYTALISIILGFLSSYLLTYIVSKLLEIKYGYFVYLIVISQQIFYVLLLLVSILVSLMYPVYSSSKSSLSGTFDSQKFQHIQVRYRTLKYQNKFRLALRELGTHKKFTLSILFVFTFIAVCYMTSLVDVDKLKPWDADKYSYEAFQYYEETCYSLEECNQFKDIFSKYNIQIYESNSVLQEIDNKDTYIEGGYLKLPSQYILENCVMEGRIPVKDNEVLLGKSQIVLYEYVLEYDKNGNSMESWDEYKRISLGDSFIADGKEYTVVGTIQANESKYFENYIEPFELYYMPTGIYVNENAYNTLKQISDDRKYICRIYYDSIEEGKEILDLYQKEYKIGKLLSSNGNLESLQAIPDSLLDINPKLLILPVLVGFIFIYFLNKNHMLNNVSNIALFKLIGMTDKELMIKQLCKALIVSGIVIGIEMFWILMLNSYYNLIFIPILEFSFTVVIVCVITVIIYCLPLRGILKNNVFDLIKGDE